MYEVGAASPGAFFGTVEGPRSRGIIDKDCAVAVRKAADKSTTGIFVDVGS